MLFYYYIEPNSYIFVSTCTFENLILQVFSMPAKHYILLGSNGKFNTPTQKSQLIKFASQAHGRDCDILDFKPTKLHCNHFQPKLDKLMNLNQPLILVAYLISSYGN